MDFDSAESFQAVYTLEYVISLVLDLKKKIIPRGALTHTDVILGRGVYVGFFASEVSYCLPPNQSN